MQTPKCWWVCLKTSKMLTFSEAESSLKNHTFSSKVKCPISVKRVKHFLVRKVPFCSISAGRRRKEELMKQYSKMLTFSQIEFLILVNFDVWSLIRCWSVILSKSDLSIFDLIKLIDLKWSLISWSWEFMILVHFAKVIFWSWSLICRVQNFLILVRRKPSLLKVWI